MDAACMLNIVKAMKCCDTFLKGKLPFDKLSLPALTINHHFS